MNSFFPGLSSCRCSFAVLVFIVLRNDCGLFVLTVFLIGFFKAVIARISLAITCVSFIDPKVNVFIPYSSADRRSQWQNKRGATKI